MSVYHEMRKVPFNGNLTSISLREPNLNETFSLLCLLAMRHINKLGNDAERLDNFFFHTGEKSCVLSKVLGGLGCRVCVWR